MSVVKNAHYLLSKKIKNKTIFKTVPLKQNYKLEKRYTKNKDFNDKILKDFYKKNIN